MGNGAAGQRLPRRESDWKDFGRETGSAYVILEAAFNIQQTGCIQGLLVIGGIPLKMGTVEIGQTPNPMGRPERTEAVCSLLSDTIGYYQHQQTAPKWGITKFVQLRLHFFGHLGLHAESGFTQTKMRKHGTTWHQYGINMRQLCISSHIITYLSEQDPHSFAKSQPRSFAWEDPLLPVAMEK